MVDLAGPMAGLPPECGADAEGNGERMLLRHGRPSIHRS